MTTRRAPVAERISDSLYLLIPCKPSPFARASARGSGRSDRAAGREAGELTAQELPLCLQVADRLLQTRELLLELPAALCETRVEPLDLIAERVDLPVHALLADAQRPRRGFRQPIDFPLEERSNARGDDREALRAALRRELLGAER